MDRFKKTFLDNIRNILSIPLLVLAGLGCTESNHEVKREGSPSGSQTGIAMSQEGKVAFSEEDWKKRLTPEQYHICREKGTERAFTGKYWNTKKEGTYACVACGNELFSSGTKFESGTGWPSFWAPLSEDVIETREDGSFFMKRTEVLCSRCESHLGHVFEDGPAPTNLRYCLNSAALNLVEKRGEGP